MFLKNVKFHYMRICSMTLFLRDPSIFLIATLPRSKAGCIERQMVDGRTQENKRRLC